MAGMAGISSGRILRVKEVLELGDSLQGKSVRTWGKVISHDIASSQVKIKDCSHELILNTSLVEPLAFAKGSLYHFIGEVGCSPGIPMVLKVRVAGCIDSMDMTLFQQSLEIRRQYLQEQVSSPL